MDINSQDLISPATKMALMVADSLKMFWGMSELIKNMKQLKIRIFLGEHK
jgi:hypothetical protein